MADPLVNYRDSEFNGVKELADAAESILRAVGASQGKGTVTEYPNERTIRYYLTEGLLRPPIDKRGLTSVFGYEHLLTLLVIKKLQAEGLPISVIKTVIGGKAIDELESLIEDEVRVFKHRTDLYNDRSKTGDMNDMDLSFSLYYSRPASQPPPTENKAKEYLESLLLDKPGRSSEDDSGALFSRAAPSMVPAPEPPVPAAESWRRYTVVPGVEIHIEKNFKPPRNERERSRILEAIERILHFRLRK